MKNAHSIEKKSMKSMKCRPCKHVFVGLIGFITISFQIYTDYRGFIPH